MQSISTHPPKIAVIGLGYVGLPLAVEFARKYPVTGFDINAARIAELRQGQDHTREVEADKLLEVLSQHPGSQGLFISADPADIAACNVFIVTVPTPTDRHNRPVLTPLIKASETVGRVLKQGDLVVYESTVYPGLTEEECIPVLEKVSGLKYNTGFFAGYSPERINPGDKERTVTKIRKVTSGSTPEAADYVDALYASVITAGTYKASSIRVAEAAKVIENAQRDINIAFVNELAMIFNRLGLDTHEVLAAAGTKWNFLPFKPGLVGGHCIGVDPYYLAQKAQETGYHPEIMLAGRRLNDSMGKYVATEVVKLMMKKGLKVIESKVLILGFTFKENCPDVRNTRVIDIYNELRSFDMEVDVYDPLADREEIRHEYGLTLADHGGVPNLEDYAAIIVAVAHQEFLGLPICTAPHRVVFDVKACLPVACVDRRL